MIRDMRYSSIHAQALSAPPYIIAFIVVITTAYLSNRHRTHSVLIIFYSLLPLPKYAPPLPRSLPATAGSFSCIAIIITWTINNQESDSRKGTGMEVLNVIGQSGQPVGTSIFPEEDRPCYVLGMSVCAGFMLLMEVLAAVSRLVLKMQNLRAKSKGSEYAGIQLEEGGWR